MRLVLSACFVVSNLADAWLTQKALALGAVELNPIIGSVGGNLLVKLLLALGVVGILELLNRYKGLKTDRILLGLCIGLALIVAWNVAVVLQLN